MSTEEKKTDNLISLKDFFESDMKIKESLIKSTPTEMDDYNEESRIKYIDKLDEELKYFKEQFLSITMKFNFGSSIEKSINEYFLKAKENLVIGDFKKGISKSIYVSNFSNMRPELVEEVKKSCVGYSIDRIFVLDSLIKKSQSINELLHVFHSYIMNNEDILESIPKLGEKTNSIGEPIVLYGEENEVAKKIFDDFPLDMDCGITDIISLENKVLMMVRDRGHALSIDINTANLDEIDIKYFVPKLCNREMIEKLPGINKSGISENGATGLLVSSKEQVTDKLFDFIERVPTDGDIVIENRYNSKEPFKSDEYKEVTYQEINKPGKFDFFRKVLLMLKKDDEKDINNRDNK
ncbi:MAG: hypothetical protein IKG42_04605 [Clostridia bacterium]|nr:hypothetical protein [Clostridia bacterium]